MFYYDGEFVTAKLLEVGVMHPESLDETYVVPGNMWVLCAVVVVKGENLFGSFRSNLLKFNMGGESKPNLRGKDGGVEIAEIDRKAQRGEGKEEVWGEPISWASKELVSHVFL